jgi:hypothetical protein
LGLTIEVEKEMNKEVKPKKKEADVSKLQDFFNQLPKGINVKVTTKGTVLRHNKLYLMHVKQSPKGILHFLRTKTGQHLQSGYATNKKEIDALLQEINDKIKQGEESKSTSPPQRVKNEKAKA